MSNRSFEEIKNEVNELFEKEYKEIIESGIYRNPINYYLVCSYPIEMPVNPSDPKEMFKNFKGEIALYFHIPFCIKRCTFCNFHLHTKSEIEKLNQSNLIQDYLKALDLESKMIISSLKEGNSDFKIHSIYIGGGTPTYLSDEELKFLINNVIKRNFNGYINYSEQFEFTIESSPGTINKSKIELLKSLGITRLSIGIQTFDDYTLKLMNRDHNSDKAVESIRLAKEYFKDNLNIDIIPGFPIDNKTENTAFKRLYNDLIQIKKLEIPSVTFYHLWTRGMNSTGMMKNIKIGKWSLPSLEETTKCWLLINKMLNKEFDKNNEYIQNPAGWFIRDKNSLFKQQIFKWHENQQYLGIGVSAYDYFNGFATKSLNGNNLQGTKEYIERVFNNSFGYEKVWKLKDEEIDRLKAVFSIKTLDGLDLNKLNNKDRFNNEIDLLQEFGLVTKENAIVKLTNKGFIFFDEVSEFFFNPKELKQIGKYSYYDLFSICRERVNFLIRKSIKENEQELKNCSSNDFKESFDKFLSEKLYPAIRNAFDNALSKFIGKKYKRALFIYIYYEKEYYGKEPKDTYFLLKPFYTKPNNHYQNLISPWFLKKIENNEAISLTQLIFSSPSKDLFYFPEPISFSLEEPKDFCDKVNIIQIKEVQNFILEKIKGLFHVHVSLNTISSFFETNKALTPCDLDKILNTLNSDGSKVVKKIKYDLINLMRNKYEQKAEDLSKLLDDANKLWPSFLAFLGNDDKETKHYVFIPLDLNERCLPIGVVLELSDMLNDEEFFKVYNFLISTLPIISKFQERIKADIKHRESLENLQNYSTSSILTESYAHNIGAHGLEGLKIELINQWENVKKSILNSDHNESLIQIRSNLIKEMKIIDKDIKSIIRTHSNFPEYLNYLQEKSAFWASISRGGTLIGGIITNVWELINDFAKNNLLCGSLGASEGYKGVEFFVKYTDDENNNNKFICLGLSTIEDDLRFRFDEEDLLGGNNKDAYTQRTVLKLDTEKLEELEKLKENLEKLKIFLPEGIVGKQAVYTIWENIIRNVKHCIKPPNNDYIPFYIEINDIKNEEWIRITNWINLDAGDSNTLNEKVNQMNSWQGIIDKDNKPNMGGTSQNILCAGMVFAQSFINTQKLQKSKNKIIDFTLDNNRIKYTFRIWKGKDVEKFEKIKNQKISDFDQPIGRFRIIKVKNEDEEEELLSKEYFLRYVRVNENSDFYPSYEKWINDWIGIDENDDAISIKIDRLGNYFKNLKEVTNNQSNIYNYYFYHGNPEGTKANYWINYKFNDKIGILIKESAAKNNIYELFELLKVKIEIFDKRLKRLTDKDKFKISPNLSSFYLNVYGEEEKSIPEDNSKEKVHFGIFHLSFLETITGCQNSEAIKKFFNNKNYSHLKKRYKIIFITSGRGRKWWDGLGDTPELKQKIKYLSIENLEYCFEKAEYFAPKTPTIGAKYALVKTIFGS